MTKKKVLLTNFRIKDYTGSEIDTVTIANYFILNGYEVDIITLEGGSPLIDNINKDIKVYNIVDDKINNKKYDLIWSHHYPLLDNILFFKNITAKHIIYLSLSSYESIEAYPNYYKELSIICTHSKESKDVHNKLIKDKDIYLFPNYATDEYFNYKINKKRKLKRICIVSNHVPDELYDFAKIAKENNYIVDIYGQNDTFVKVDDKLLKRYDLIVTIGKTVLYGLAMGIPVYCYDRFGGDGYITEENIVKSMEYNFSARAFRIKLTGKEIYDDIINNYNNCIKSIDKVKEFALNNFNLDNNMKKILKLLNNDNKVNVRDIKEKYKYLDVKSRTFVEWYFAKNNIIIECERKIEVITKRNNDLERELKENTCNYQVELSGYKNEINELLNSTSWKITKPLRLIKRIIFKIIH